jgi:hypothetical protein
MNGPTPSCVEAHTQQLQNNRYSILRERLMATSGELELAGEVGRLQNAQDAYDRGFSATERALVNTGLGYFAREAAAAQEGLVAPRQKRVRDLALDIARHERTAQIIEQTNRDIEARGPQPTGECNVVTPRGSFGDRPARSLPFRGGRDI